jgi:tRNA dimethylallyltransferase
MNSLLGIVGPTGVGKTALAIEIAKLTPSILVSADSRQVYREMDIVTGKDHPKDLKIYGIDICDPDKSCSVAVWYDAVRPAMEKAWRDGKLVIVVGGTGLYLRAVTEGIETMQVPINEKLRDELGERSVTELQEKLSALSPEKLTGMNHSDQGNPRRLVRAIEVAQYEQGTPLTPKIDDPRSTRLIGLRPPVSGYSDIVTKRVKQRLQNGAVEETKKLLTMYGKDLQSFSAIGYRSIAEYLEGKLCEEEMTARWVADELAYAKRQMTWFRKVGAIKWYDKGITGQEVYGSSKN